MGDKENIEKAEKPHNQRRFPLNNNIFLCERIQVARRPEEECRQELAQGPKQFKDNLQVEILCNVKVTNTVVAIDDIPTPLSPV